MFKIDHGFSQVNFLDLLYMKTKKITKITKIIMKITFIVYNLNPTSKFQKLILL